MIPEIKCSEQELNPITSSGYVSFDTIRKDTGGVKGREYRKQEKYSSGWKILPDLVANLLMGYGGEQEFKMRKYGMHQGTIKVSLCTNKRFSPSIGTSGSLETAFMAEPVIEFLKLNGLREYYNLQNQMQINLIHSFFCSLILGNREGSCEVFDNTIVRYSLSKYSFSVYVEGTVSQEIEKLMDFVEGFFRTIGLTQILGKNK